MSIVCQNRRHRRGQRRLSTLDSPSAPGAGNLSFVATLSTPPPHSSPTSGPATQVCGLPGWLCGQTQVYFPTLHFEPTANKPRVVAATRPHRNMRRKKSIHVRNTWTDCGVQCMAKGLVCNLLTTTLHGVCRLGSLSADGRCLPLASWR